MSFSRTADLLDAAHLVALNDSLQSDEPRLDVLVGFGGERMNNRVVHHQVN